jgi:hypothetical protein
MYINKKDIAKISRGFIKIKGCNITSLVACHKITENEYRLYILREDNIGKYCNEDYNIINMAKGRFRIKELVDNKCFVYIKLIEDDIFDDNIKYRIVVLN